MFFLTNIATSSLKNNSGLYWGGTAVQERGNDLIVSKSVNSFNSFDADLANFEVGTDPLEKYDATFVLGKFSNGTLKIQTDIVGFEPCFYYNKDGKFIFSSCPDEMLKFLSSHKIELSLSEKKTRDMLYWGANFEQDTVVDEIHKLTGGVKATINLDGALKIETIYQLEIAEKVSDAKTAAKNLYSLIENRFKQKISKQKRYGLGLSGGLDSRVAGYFAKLTNANITPYFVGNKTGMVGQYTYDAKRSLEVEKSLGLPSVRFVNPLETSWDAKIEKDLEFATLMSSNAHINSGYDFGNFDIILNGAMGGELFGACVSEKLTNMTAEQLAQYLLEYIVLLPREKFPNNIFAKVLYKKNVLKSCLTVPNSMYSELMPESQMQMAKNQMTAWVQGLKEQGISNVKIVQLDLYHRYARNHFYGYFYGFNATKQVLPVYLTPSVIKEMMTWKSDLFIGKKVQVEFLKLLSGLSEIRSQNTEPSVNTTSGAGIKRFVFGLERVLRGGGMDYRRWILQNNFEGVERKQLQGFNDLNQKNPYWKNAPILRLTMLKIALLKKRYNITRTV